MRSIRLIITVLFISLLFNVAISQYLEKIEINNTKLQFIKINTNKNGNIAEFSGDDLSFVSLPGDPDIPYRHFQVLLPSNADLSSIKINTEKLTWKKEERFYNVKPAPPAATRDGEQVIVVFPEEQDIINGKNIKVYHKDTFYPNISKVLLHTGHKGTYKILSFDFPCVRYNPVSRQIKTITGGSLLVEYKLSDKNTEDDLSFFPELDNEILIYESALETYTNGSRNGTNTIEGYVIITTSTIVNNSSKLDEFINAKENMGYTVTLVTESEWGGGTGDNAAENIHDWLEDNYVNLNLQYVLLIGDPDPSDGDVPMKMLWPRRNATNYTQYKEAPSDYYYSDMTGNWDLDGDGYFGEYGDDTGTGGCDKNFEFIVGRIPYYGSVSDLDNILTKLVCFTYEPLSMCSWRENVILPMEPSDASTPGYHLGEAINDDFVQPKTGWNSHRIYEEDYGLPDPPETTPCNYSNVYNAWIADHPSVALWWTHGSSTSAADIMNTSYAAQLNDSLPAFTFQCSCNNAYPENSSNLAYSLLKNGSPGTNAATRVSWYYVGQTSYNNSASNSGMTYEFAERFIQDEETNGYSLFDLKQDLSYYSDAIWMNFCVFNQYGDPSLETYTPCQYTMNLFNANVTDDSWRFYASSGSIIFAGDSGNYVIEGTTSNTQQVTATSDTSIIFKPGFHAESGSRFKAWIGDGCTVQTPANYSNQYLSLSNSSINNKVDETTFSIFPNPANDFITVTIPQQIICKNLSLSNLHGIVLFSSIIKPGKNFIEIEVSDIVPGIYVVALDADKEELTKKLIIY